jgi:hypothetical protein
MNRSEAFSTKKGLKEIKVEIKKKKHNKGNE